MGVRLFSSEVVQLPSEKFFEHVESLWIHRELGHLLDYLLEQDGLLVVVATQTDLHCIYIILTTIVKGLIILYNNSYLYSL